MNAELEQYFKIDPDTPRKRGKGASEWNEKRRKEKIDSQVHMKTIDPDIVKEWVESFLLQIGVETGNRIANKGDFLWIKFTKDNFVGVVAAGCDFNFSYKNRSGKYLKEVGKEWNENLLLVFPISKYPEGKTRGDIERAVGNYLIKKKVPIIDFYSHNY